MRIGIFDPYLDTLGGGEKYMLTVASCLSKEHDVYLFWNEHLILRNAVDRFALDLSRVRLVRNIFSKEISFFRRVLETRKYDLIIYLSDGSIPFTLTKKDFIHFQFPVEWVDGRSFKTRLKLLKITKIICNSYFTKSFIDKKFGIKSIVLYPPAQIITGKTKKENIILHVGRFGISIEGSNFKKQDIIIEAFRKMVDNGLMNWRFILVISSQTKDKERLEELEEKAKGLPIEFVKNPKNQILLELYRKAKIYWHASGFGEDLEKHPEYAEHFGISTVEAMGAGAVPVVINAGGQPEIIEDGKNGFLWNTLEELMGKTRLLINDEKLWGKMSKDAKERAQTFSGDRFCRELKELIGL